MPDYTYAVEYWDSRLRHPAWVPQLGYTGTMEYPGEPAQLARRVLNGYIADVASDAGLPVGVPGSGPAAMTRVVVWRGSERDTARTAAVVLSHNDDDDRAVRRLGRPVWQGLPEPATWTAVEEGARDIARRMLPGDDVVGYRYLRDIKIVDPNDLEPGDAFRESERALATGGFWMHARSVSCGPVWLHVQVTMLPDQDIAQAERLLG